MYFRPLSVLLLTIAGIFSPHSLLAQVESDSVRTSLAVTVGGRRQAGAFSQTLVTVTGNGSIQAGRWSLDNNTTYSYSIANQFLISNDWTVVTKLRYSPGKEGRISPTLLHIYKDNLIYRIQNSQRGFLGVNIIPLRQERDFWLFVGGGFEHTRYDGDIFFNSPAINSVRTFPLATAYLQNQHTFGAERVSLGYALFYLQSLTEARDWTVWLIPSLNFSITPHLALGVNYDYRFRNVHLEEIPGVNEQLTFSLTIKTGN